jgi:carbamoyl-phosphate synthase large subunit
MSRSLTVAVTGLNNIDSPGPGVPVIRALREAEGYDLRVIGLSYESLEPGIYLPGVVDRVYQIPYPSAGSAVLFERLRYIHQREGLDLVIPNFDAELFNFIVLADRLRHELGIRSVLPDLPGFQAREKARLSDYGRQHGLDVPEARLVHGLPELQAAGAELGYPLVVKGQYYEGEVARGPEEAAKHFHRIAAKWGLPVIAQQFVRGLDLNVCGIADGKGGLIGAVPMRKLYVTQLGKAWAGVSLDDEALLALTRRFAESTRWRGPFELEFIKSEEDERYHLLEINPRFPAWVYLAVACGQNQPEALVRLAFGEDVPPLPPPAVGRIFIRYSQDLIVDMADYERIALTGER